MYGLGNLATIFDERRVQQATLLLSRLREDLRTFVPTSAYRDAAAALADHGFVLLLGEPASGKSTIAATLAIAALDSWGTAVRRVDSAEELLANWDPDEPDQLFWVDDAFGSIRFSAELTDGWARRMDQVMTAIAHGAKVVLTSRDYIYRDARPWLREYAYPRLREQRVVIDITALSTDEKRQMLYNHLRAGDQERGRLRSWQPFLPAIAEIDRFQPELARRLSFKAFTTDGLVGEQALLRFFQHPTAFLIDVLGQLDLGSRGALACVYASGDELAAPVDLVGRLSEVVTELGASVGSVRRAFAALDGTFLLNQSNTHGVSVWRFRHPTIREGFAALIANDPNAIRVLLNGMNDKELVTQIDCGGRPARGTLIRVPDSMYEEVAQRIALPPVRTGYFEPVAAFLTSRCSTDFLRIWATLHGEELERLLGFSMYTSAFWQPEVLAALNRAGALPEDIRHRAATMLIDHSDDLDSGWASRKTQDLLTAEEFRDTQADVRFVLIDADRFWDLIESSADGWDADVEPQQRFDQAREAIANYRRIFADDQGALDALNEAEERIRRAVSEREETFVSPSRPHLGSQSPLTAQGSSVRSEFDDVADER